MSANGATGEVTPWLRKEVIGDATLYLGDCREIVPVLGRFDAVVTDPPYGIDYGRGGGFSKSHGWGAWRENVGWDAERPARDIFDLMRAKSDVQIIWGGNYFTDYLPPTMQWLVWDKGQRDFSLADCEFAWSSQWKASRIFTYGRGAALRDGKVHPTQKPIQLMLWCLGFVPNAKRVLDPFMGSGTTGVAALKRGLRFTGIELDAGYFEAACSRLRETIAQPDFLVSTQPAPKPASQSDMFDGVAGDE